jgi:hypothetical protein
VKTSACVNGEQSSEWAELDAAQSSPWAELSLEENPWAGLSRIFLRGEHHGLGWAVSSLYYLTKIQKDVASFRINMERLKTLIFSSTLTVCHQTIFIFFVL